MGQVIRFNAIPRGYPGTAAALDAAERLLLRAVRAWVVAFRQAAPPLPGLCADLEAAGVGDAAFPVDALMTVMARSARRTIEIRCPSCPRLSDDEQRLLQAASLTQGGDIERAERVLRTALLTAQGAEFALGPLEGLGDVLAAAGLFFGRRVLPEPAPEQCGSDPEGWTPASAPLWH